MTVPQRLTERKREAILQSAIAEFRSSGFEITSMDRIAATAGVSKRTVYNHFPSKEALFAEILNRLWNSITAEQLTPYSPDQPLRDQLRTLLQAKLQMLADENFLDLARIAIAATIHSLSGPKTWLRAWASAKKAWPSGFAWPRPPAD